MNRLAGEKRDDEENKISSDKHLKTNLEITNQKDDKSTNDNSIKKSSNSNEDNHENDEQKAIKPNLNKQNYLILDSLSPSVSHHNSNNFNKNQQLLQPQKQIKNRRPSIFDYVNLNEKIANMENEFKDGVDENKSNSSATTETNRSSHIPLLHISYATLDKEAGTFMFFVLIEINRALSVKKSGVI